MTKIDDSAFASDANLKEITYPSKVVTVASNSSGITKVTFSAGMTAVPANACYGLMGLTTVEYQKDANGKVAVESIGNSAFRGCKSLTSVSISETVTELGTYVYYDCTNLTEITLPSGLVKIGNNAFQNCSLLKKIELPDGLASIANNAFDGCKSLTDIRLPDKIKTIGTNAFVHFQEVCISRLSLES